MIENPKYTTIEFIDGLLEIVSRFKETLVSAKAFVEMNNDMVADGGDPFEDPFKNPFEPCSTADDKIEIPDVEPARFGELPKGCKEDLAEGIHEGLSRGEEVKARTHGGRRARVTKETRERIIAALLKRVPKPRMVDVAEEFNVSQTTVSRVWGIYQADRTNQGVSVETPKSPSDTGGSSGFSRNVSLPGQLDLPVISEGRKPGPED